MKFSKNIWMYVFAFLVVVASILIFRGMTGNAVSENIEGLAIHLTETGAVMYGTNWCSYCQGQKDLFGRYFRHIEFVDCDFRREECLIAGVQGYPTWKINGQSYSGIQSLERLAQLSDYQGDL